jgi:type I restriction enzyme S subunit
MDFHELPILVPPIRQQAVIVNFLDVETARIEALIARKKSLVECLEERWRLAIAHRVRELGDLHGWIPLKRLVVCLDGMRVPLSAEERSHRHGPYPYFGASGQIDMVNDFLFDERLVLLGEDGAQLADSSYEIARVVKGKVWVNNHAHVLRPVKADSDFLVSHLNTFNRPEFISGATREKLTQEDMNRITVPHLDVSEQIREGAKFRELRNTARTLSTKILSQLELLREHRQALITAAVTGEVGGLMIGGEESQR